MKQINGRIERFRVIAILVVVLALIGAGLSAYAISIPHSATGAVHTPITQSTPTSTPAEKQVPAFEDTRPGPGVIKEEIPASAKPEDISAAEKAVEKRLSDYADLDLSLEVDMFARQLTMMMLHWQSALARIAVDNEYPVSYEDEKLKTSNISEYTGKWPEIEALRITILSRLPEYKAKAVADRAEFHRLDRLLPVYLYKPEDVGVVRDYLKALAERLDVRH